MTFRVFSFGWMLGMVYQAILAIIGSIFGKLLRIENSTYCNWFSWFSLVSTFAGWAIGFYLKFLDHQ